MSNAASLLVQARAFMFSAQLVVAAGSREDTSGWLVV